jgi:hypothetical protein
MDPATSRRRAPYGGRTNRGPCVFLTACTLVAISAVLGGGAFAADSAEPPGPVLKQAAHHDYPESTADLACSGDAKEAPPRARPAHVLAAQRELMDMNRLHTSSAAGVVACPRAGTLIVHRVPGDRAYDKDVRAVATRHGATVRFVDARWSRLELLVARQAVMDRSGRLARQGAVLESVRIVPTGYVQVGLSGRLGAAKEVFADIADRTRVVEGFLGTAEAEVRRA